VDRGGDAAAAEAEVRALNPTVTCVRAEFGDVDPAALLDAVPGDHVFSKTPMHEGAIRSFVLRFDQPVRRALLQQFMSTLIELRGADLLRVKGFVPVETGLVAVQGVRHVFDRLRPVERGEPALVFITNGVSQGEVQALWQAMKGLA
jgi:G3E family GTPase